MAAHLKRLERPRKHFHTYDRLLHDLPVCFWTDSRQLITVKSPIKLNAGVSVRPKYFVSMYILHVELSNGTRFDPNESNQSKLNLAVFLRNIILIDQKNQLNSVRARVDHAKK